MTRFRFDHTLAELCKTYTGEDASPHELAAALRKLTPRRQRAVQLYRDGATLCEIGKTLRVSHGSARSSFHLPCAPHQGRALHRTVQDIKARNADTDPDELQSIINDAVREVRDDRRARGKADKV